MRRTQGFTLIEVLAAIAILGVALFILLQSQWSALNIHTMMNEEVTLGQLVESIAGKAEVGVLTGLLNDGGDFGTRYPEYTWNYDAALRGDSEDAENQLYEVIITVQGPESEKSLKFFVYNNNPEASEGGMFNEGGAAGQGNARSNGGGSSRSQRGGGML